MSRVVTAVSRDVRAAILVASLSLLIPATQAGVNRWTPIGPEGGLISLLVADPQNPGTIYASAGNYRGGTVLFRSSDGGGHWTLLNLGLDEVLIERLVIDPRDSRLYLAGSAGLLRSDDRGQTWRRLGEELSGVEVRDLAIDPGNPDLLAVASNKGVWISSDRGETWRQSNGEFTHRVWASRAGFFYINGAVDLRVSRDGGQTWALVPVLDGLEDLGFDPQDPNIIYASTYNDRIFKSTDGGKSWHQASSGLPTDINESVFDQLYLDPARPETVYTVEVRGGVFVTRDGGASWLPFESPAVPSSMAFDPSNTSTMYIGAEGQGVFRSTDRGEHWESANRGLYGSWIYDIETQPRSEVNIGTFGLGMQSWTGDSWLPSNSGMPGSRFLVQDIEPDPHQPRHLLAVVEGDTDRGLYESTDSGSTWKKTSYELRDTATLAISPDLPNTIYMALGSVLGGWGARGGVVKSTDGGTTWTTTGTGYSSPTWELDLVPGQPETVYIVSGDRGGWSSLLLGIHKTTDGGATWKKVHPDEYVYCLRIDPQAPNTIYAGAGGVIYMSTDGGGSWRNLSIESPASDVVALAIDPRDPAVLWAGLDAHGKAGSKTGVFVSSDQGVTWQEFNDGLGCRRITCLAFDPDRPDRIYAGTAGGGVWSLRVANRLPRRNHPVQPNR